MALIPIRTDYRMTRRPWINYALLAANVGIFLLGHNGLEQNMPRIYEFLLHPDDPRLSQFFTSVFLHGGWMHLIGNMVFLWVFGNALNDRLGHMGYLAFYLAGGVLACVGYLLLGGKGPVLGASGAISAVTGAYLVLFPRVRVTVLAWILYFVMPLEVSSLFFLLVQFVWNMAMTADVATSSGGGGVAYSAHAAGYVFGIAVAAGLLATKLLPRDAFDLLNMIRAWRRRSRYRRMVAQGYDPFTYNRPGSGPATAKTIKAKTVETTEPDSATAREIRLRKEISEAYSRHDLEHAARGYLQLVQIADHAVLSRQQQLDIANQLMAAEQYAAAADAYERFLRHYPGYEYIADIHLMLGLVYARYLNRYDRAEELLNSAITGLTDPRKLELARGDLENIRRGRGS